MQWLFYRRQLVVRGWEGLRRIPSAHSAPLLELDTHYLFPRSLRVTGTVPSRECRWSGSEQSRVASDPSALALTVQVLFGWMEKGR